MLPDHTLLCEPRRSHDPVLSPQSMHSLEVPHSLSQEETSGTFPQPPAALGPHSGTRAKFPGRVFIYRLQGNSLTGYFPSFPLLFLPSKACSSKTPFREYLHPTPWQSQPCPLPCVSPVTRGHQLCSSGFRYERALQPMVPGWLRPLPAPRLSSGPMSCTCTYPGGLPQAKGRCEQRGHHTTTEGRRTQGTA